MRKIKKGDSVEVLVGKDKGRRGVVLAVTPSKTNCKTSWRVFVEGVNQVKRHIKPNPAAEKPGGITQKEASIDVSNVAIVNSSTGKKDRVGFKILDDGRKVRVFKSTGQAIEI